jgi:hypothetical protein
MDADYLRLVGTLMRVFRSEKLRHKLLHRAAQIIDIFERVGIGRRGGCSALGVRRFGRKYSSAVLGIFRKTRNRRSSVVAKDPAKKPPILNSGFPDS